MELYIPPKRLQSPPLTGRFIKGHIPFDKGKKWDDYLDPLVQEKIRATMPHTGGDNFLNESENELAI